MIGVPVYTAAAIPGALAHITTLFGARTEITTYWAGTRRYRAGRIILLQEDRQLEQLIGHLPDRTFWALVEDTYLRVWGITRDLNRGSGFLQVDQSAMAVAPTVHHPALRIVEPSPPRPAAEWWEPEKARAVRDWDSLRYMANAVDHILTYPETDGGQR